MGNLHNHVATAHSVPSYTQNIFYLRWGFGYPPARPDQLSLTRQSHTQPDSQIPCLICLGWTCWCCGYPCIIWIFTKVLEVNPEQSLSVPMTMSSKFIQEFTNVLVHSPTILIFSQLGCNGDVNIHTVHQLSICRRWEASPNTFLKLMGEVWFPL